jgi:hypothetical protein
MTTPSAARASESLLRFADELARATTDALYARRPDLMERWGERGRAKCLEDMRHNVEHLAPAVGLDDPSIFARYVRWLDDLLRARGIPSDDVRESLELMRDAVAARLPHDESARAAASIDAGLATLADEAAR